MKANLIDGYHGDQKTPSIPNTVLAPAGAIRSNVDDMLIFLAANMGLIRTPLLPAMKYMLGAPRGFAWCSNCVRLAHRERWNAGLAQWRYVWLSLVRRIRAEVEDRDCCAFQFHGFHRRHGATDPEPSGKRTHRDSDRASQSALTRRPRPSLIYCVMDITDTINAS